jgi:hypothetical protein
MSKFDDLPAPYEEEYSGNPVLVIPCGKDKNSGKIYSMSFGRMKAKAILHFIERIKEFANTDDVPF